MHFFARYGCGMILGAGLAWNAVALTISSALPGNLAVAGKPITLTVKAAKADVAFQCVDYFGTQAGSGVARVTGGEAIFTLEALPPGWYELRCTAAGEKAVTWMGVVIDRGVAPLPEQGRIGVDTIGSSGDYAALVRLAGLPWVRDRLWWNVVQYQAGPVDWKDYPRAARAVAGHGLRLSQVWDDSPSWVHPNTPNGKVPDDLRDIYRFARAAAGQFAGQWQAWEAGNEVDVGGGNGRADRYAGYLKAVCLGVKDGNPAAVVLNAAACWGVTPFLRLIYAGGGGAYSDIFNWHFYGVAEQYSWNLKAYLDMLAEQGIGQRPVWITEGGVPLPATDGPDKHWLSPGNQRTQCWQTAQNILMALVAGNDRYFFFCLPEYVERGLQFGLLRSDQTPYPGFLAVSALANLLGEAQYLGTYAAAPAGVKAELFSTPHGLLMAVYGDGLLTVPADLARVRVANVFGAVTAVTAVEGRIQITAGPEPVYVLDVGGRVKERLVGTATRPRGVVRPGPVSHLVLMGHSDLPVDTERCCYLLPSHGRAPFTYTVEVYNFLDKKSLSGAVEVTLPEGWTAEARSQPVTVGPMGRVDLRFRITPAPPAGLAQLDQRVAAQGRFAGEAVAPTVSGFGFDPAQLPVAETKAVDWTRREDWAPNQALWGNNMAKNGEVRLSHPVPGTLRIEAPPGQAKAGDDLFSFANLRFAPPVDLSRYDAMAFTLKGVTAPGTVRLALVEPNGAHYYATFAYDAAAPRRVVCVLRNLLWALWFTGDPNQRFDPDNVAWLKLGREGDGFAVEVSDFELLRFDRSAKAKFDQPEKQE